MRIISNFHDYYDGALAHGADPSLVYVRREAPDLGFSNWGRPFGLIGPYGSSYGRGAAAAPHPAISVLALGFCGHIHKVLEVARPGSPRPEHFYTWERVQEELERLGQMGWMASALRKDWEAHDRDDDAPFIQQGCPAFRVDLRQGDNWRDALGHMHYGATEVVLTRNPSLKALEFYKLKDAFTAFQDIATYLGNTLVRRDDPGGVAEGCRIAQHGYDRWSFRTHPDDSKKPRGRGAAPHTRRPR